MSKIVLFGLIFGGVGLVVGYLIFGHVGGEFIPLGNLFSPPQDFLDEIQETITGIRQIRERILVSGAVGLGFGVLLGAVLRKR